MKVEFIKLSDNRLPVYPAPSIRHYGVANDVTSN